MFASHGAGGGDRRDVVRILLCLSSPWLSRPRAAPPGLDSSRATAATFRIAFFFASITFFGFDTLAINSLAGRCLTGNR